MTQRAPWASGMYPGVGGVGAPTIASVSPTIGTDAGGYTMTITGTNYISGATVTVGGSSATSVSVVNSTTITCTVPAGSDGAANVVVTTSNGTGTLSNGFTYVAPLDWFSDFRNATGTGSSAIKDGTKWNDTSGSATLLDVIASTGLGFPSAMTNVMQVNGNAPSTNSQKVIALNVGVNPSVGQYQFTRYYMRVSWVDGEESGGAHCVENDPGNLSWFNKALTMGTPSTGTYKFTVGFNGGGDINYYFTNSSSSLTKSAVYRVEQRFYLHDWDGVSTGTFYYATQIFDSTNTVIFTESSFVSNGNSAQLTNSTAMTVQNPSGHGTDWIGYNLSSFDCGNPGQVGTNWQPGDYVYFGGFAIRKSASSSAWIGAYPLAGSES